MSPILICTGHFLTTSRLRKSGKRQRLLFSPGQGTFQGKRGFLFFETAEAGIARAVPAEEVASLLAAEHRVPIAVLNACQSATQTATEAGLAQRLTRSWRSHLCGYVLFSNRVRQPSKLCLYSTGALPMGRIQSTQSMPPVGICLSIRLARHTSASSSACNSYANTVSPSVR